jgi:hypothetical protein
MEVFEKLSKRISCANHFDEYGFAIYKHPDNKWFVIKGGIKLDNRWIVPHNIGLLKKYDAHINIEWCNNNIFIKYLFKYVTKGPECEAYGEETDGTRKIHR